MQFWIYIHVHSKKIQAVALENYRPGQALKFPGGWGSQISRQSAHEGGKVVSPTHRPPLPPGNIPDTHFCYRLRQPQGHGAAGKIITMKIPMTSSGIEPASFRLVARWLNQLRHRVPQHIHIWTSYSRALFEKLTVLQLVKKFPAFYGNWISITAFTRAHSLSLYRARSIQSKPHPLYWIYLLILSSHLRLGRPSGFFTSGSPQQNPLCTSPHPHTCHMLCPPRYSWLYHPYNIW